MDIDRRSLMKGVLATGALLAMGAPPWTFGASAARRPELCVLVLGDTGADDVFATGARAACADLAYEGLWSVKVNGGLLTGMGRMINLLERFRSARWIAILDDASGVIFVELARAAGGRLLSMGTHACSTDGSPQLRHAWATASPEHGVGGLLASQLVHRHDGFSITEGFLHTPVGAWELASWSAPGFSSYQLTTPEEIHLHCSGLSPLQGCELAGLTATEGWEPIPPQACTGETVRRRAGDWVESVGYAVAASALGINSIRESCASRAFVRRSRDGERLRPTERFVSFVMDL